MFPFLSLNVLLLPYARRQWKQAENQEKKSQWGKDEGSWHGKMSIPLALAADGTSRNREIKGFA